MALQRIMRDMATNTPVNSTDIPNTKVLANGAVYDMGKKRIVAMKPELATKNTQITHANASAYQARIQANKRERIVAGANAAVAGKGSYDGVGDDWIEAIAEQVTLKALDRLDPQQVNAARFVFNEAGISHVPDGGGSGAGALGQAVAAGLVELLGLLGHGSDSVVDGQVTSEDTDTSAHSEDTAGAE
jgi:hypothetical protein